MLVLTLVQTDENGLPLSSTKIEWNFGNLREAANQANLDLHQAIINCAKNWAEIQAAGETALKK